MMAHVSSLSPDALGMLLARLHPDRDHAAADYERLRARLVRFFEWKHCQAPDQLAEMSVEERVELLKLNIRRFTHDLLHYDVVEIRLLDKKTGRLEPLLSEGMTPVAATRELYPKPEGNGVTGFVASTGKSYLCPDTATDPLYIEGASGARSSLTVPLIAQDEVIGTFNVESPQPNAFGEDDLQFAEIFSREIAATLHTLELLSAEKRSTATQSIELISREVALPVDEILAEHGGARPVSVTSRRWTSCGKSSPVLDR